MPKSEIINSKKINIAERNENTQNNFFQRIKKKQIEIKTK